MFDQSNYGEAVQWLVNSVAGFEQFKMPDYLPYAYNYLAQVALPPKGHKIRAVYFAK